MIIQKNKYLYLFENLHSKHTKKIRPIGLNLLHLFKLNVLTGEKFVIMFWPSIYYILNNILCDESKPSMTSWSSFALLVVSAEKRTSFK